MIVGFCEFLIELKFTLCIGYVYLRVGPSRDTELTQ